MTPNLSNPSRPSSLPWPQDFQEHKATIEASWKLETLSLHRQLSGKSGAMVYLAHVQSKGTAYSGFGILKLEKKGPWTKPEASQLEKARHHSGEEADKHLSRTIYEYSSDNTTCYLFTIAANGLEYVFPLAQLSGNTATIIKTVGDGLVHWAALNHVKSEPKDGPEILKQWLGYRLESEQGGGIPAFLKQCGVREQSLSFSAASSVYPNPLAYCAGAFAEEEKLPIYPLLGQQHGDCHGNNILIRQEHQNAIAEYYLIDFALYEEHLPLFYDHAYLEVSLLLDYAGFSDDGRWDALLTMCGKRPGDANRKLLTTGDDGIVGICRTLRLTVDGWIHKAHMGIQSSGESQQYLARIAAGLNYANKVGLESTLRFKAILYAAHQLKEYFRFKNIQVPLAGDSLIDPTASVSPSYSVATSSTWREVWQHCSEFRAENAYALVVGKMDVHTLPDLAVLGRLPWALVIDLDPNSRSSGLLAAAESEIKRKRGFHLQTPEQEVDINFDQGTLWLMARGIADRPDTIARDAQAWRFGVVPKIGRALDTLRRKIAPRQIRVVFLANTDEDRGDFEMIADRLQEIFYAASPKLIFCRNPGVQPFLTSERCVDVACAPEEWIREMHRHFGRGSESNVIFLPKRLAADTTVDIVSEQSSFSLDVDLLNIGEDLEIVHPGLDVKLDGISPGDFLRGNTITWAELARGYDVRFDMYPNLKREVVKKLEAYSNETIELFHTPGGGGTTVGRRLAWDLHMDFPCAVLRNVSDATAARVATLYRLTNLPVLLIIDAGTITEAEMQRLYSAVRKEHARAVFLYVVRANGNVDPKKGIAAPLSEPEAEKFLGKYAQTDERVMRNLQRLAKHDDMLPYRAPFFFGLFAFEENFTHVQAYVQSHLAGLSERGTSLLRYLALVTKFSQATVDRAILASLADRVDDESFSLESILGMNASKLVTQDYQNGRITVRIVHPIIAEKILRLTSPDGGDASDGWKRHLEALSCEFVVSLSAVCGPDSEDALKLISQMFIQREPWSDAADSKRKNFSQLILMIPSESAQGHVLKTLTENFSQEAHFWNHRGRHSNLVLRENYEEAERLLQEAIRLAPGDPLHRHSLGMIYRLEIERLLARRTSGLAGSGELEASYEEISGLFKLAETSFADARKLEPESEYGYVANIQLGLTVIERLFRISGEKVYANLFRQQSKISTWLRSILERMKELLDDVTHPEGAGESSYVKVCSAKYRGLIGDYDAMISGLSSVLSIADSEKSSLRRLITDCIINHQGSNWAKLSAKNLKNILELARGNIDSGTANRRDFINWFQAYRRTPSFDFNEAIAMFDLWAADGDPVDAHYYLYVLHFLKWYRGLTTGLSNCRMHLDKTIKIAGDRHWSYEWMGHPNEDNFSGLIHPSELGNWGRVPDGHLFYSQTGALLRVSGVITHIANARAGKMTIYSTEEQAHGRRVEKIDAHFVPGTEFISGRDENVPITAFIGFAYSGLSAWIPKRI